MEEAKAVEILKSYKRVAEELRQRLSRLPPDIFTAQQIRVVLIQLELAISSFQKRLDESARDATMSISDQALSDTVEEVNSFQDYFQGSVQPISLNLVLESAKESELLINQFQVSIDSYSNTLRNQIWTRLNDMLIARRPAEEIHADLVRKDGIANFFEGEAWRLRRIVRTEMHGVYSRAKLNGFSTISKEHAPGLLKALYHPLDHRTANDSQLLIMAAAKAEKQDDPTDPVNVQHPKLGILEQARVIAKMEDDFFYTYQEAYDEGKLGKKIQRIYKAPPDRPNDRAILIPYHESWTES